MFFTFFKLCKWYKIVQKCSTNVPELLTMYFKTNTVHPQHEKAVTIFPSYLQSCSLFSSIYVTIKPSPSTLIPFSIRSSAIYLLNIETGFFRDGKQNTFGFVQLKTLYPGSNQAISLTKRSSVNS